MRGLDAPFSKIPHHIRVTVDVDGQAFHFSSFVQLAERGHNAKVSINLLHSLPSVR